jgi:hypothetical protein
LNQADRLREAERHALAARAVAGGESAGDVRGALARFGALVPAARLSLHLAPRRTAGNVA